MKMTSIFSLEFSSVSFFCHITSLLARNTVKIHYNQPDYYIKNKKKKGDNIIKLIIKYIINYNVID